MILNFFKKMYKKNGILPLDKAFALVIERVPVEKMI